MYQGKMQQVYMHRMIMGAEKGKGEVDHINGNRLDNRKENLRFVGREQNLQNKPKKKGCHSQYVGVSKKEGRWIAYIGFQGKLQHLGYFDKEVEAASAYNEKAKELYGEHASLNTLLE